MATMMQSKANRIRFAVDNPWDSDGFYNYLRPKARRKAIRTREKREWRTEIQHGEDGY